MTIEEIMRTAPVIPVLVVERLEDAVPMAEALVAGGLRVLEVTLRTPVALVAIRAMREVDGAIVQLPLGKTIHEMLAPPTRASEASTQ